jgi:hypothetical protein
MHQLGLPQVFKQLGNRRGPYRGVYLTTFCAMSEVLEEGALAIGPQFAEWGVQLDRDDPAGRLGEMFVPAAEGVDSATATAFIKLQITSCVQWSVKMAKVIQLSQVRGERFERHGGSKPTAWTGWLTGCTPLLPRVFDLLQRAALSRMQAAAAGQAAGSVMAAREPVGKCAFCGLEAGTGIPKTCQCGMHYCSKTCQVADFPKHKKKCKAAAKS